MGQRQHKWRAREDPRLEGYCGGRARGGERTWNIKRIFVTRDVSKFTGWLKASALCRVEKAGHAMRGEVCGPEGGGARAWGSG